MVVLDGGGSYTQNKDTGSKTRISYEEGQYVMHVWLPSKEEEAQEETEKALQGNPFAILATESDLVLSQPAGVGAVSQHQDDQQGEREKE